LEQLEHKEGVALEDIVVARANRFVARTLVDKVTKD